MSRRKGANAPVRSRHILALAASTIFLFPSCTDQNGKIKLVRKSDPPPTSTIYDTSTSSTTFSPTTISSEEVPITTAPIVSTPTIASPPPPPATSAPATSLLPTTTEPPNPIQVPEPQATAPTTIVEEPQNLGELLATQSVRVDSNGGSCTGMIINRRYLISGGHCVENHDTGQKAKNIEYRFWQDGFEELRGRATQWRYRYDKLDVLVAELDPESDLSLGLRVPNLPEQPPAVGTQVTTASLSNGRKLPLIAKMTYIGGDANQYAFAVNADNDPEVIAEAFEPGVSGALAVTDTGQLSIVKSVMVDQDGPGSSVSIAEDVYNVDLPGVQQIVFGTPLTRTVFDELVLTFG